MAAHANYQTIRLSRGKHSSAEEGACVMELASMLARERFSDHPECASPVIGAFLRLYNDALDDCRRQDLYPYAASVVGTRASTAVESSRAEQCRTWACARAFDPAQRRWTRRRLIIAVQFHACATPDDRGGMAARIAVERVRREGDSAHIDALAFIDELIAGPRASGFPDLPPDRERLSLGRR